MKFFSKKVFLFSLLAFFLSVGLASAQSPVQKAIEDVKDRVDDLATAKDKGQPNDLSLRTEAFKKVFDLSVAESKDLKVKLLSLNFKPEEEAKKAWQDRMAKEIGSAISYYENWQESLLTKEFKSLSEIKSAAEEFKSWREKNYLPFSTQINDFLLIEQEEDAIQIAQKRYQKIKEDLAKLLKIDEKFSDLRGMLEKANELIGLSLLTNKDAKSLFEKEFILVGEFAPPKPKEGEQSEIIPLETQTPAELTQVEEATSTDSVQAEPPPPPPSIRDLVRSSLSKIKETYQVFIEMSNFVRKLLK